MSYMQSSSNWCPQKKWLVLEQDKPNTYPPLSVVIVQENFNGTGRSLLWKIIHSSTSLWKRKYLNTTMIRGFLILCFVLNIEIISGSEYPGRECCDSAPPPPPQYYTTTSTSPVPPVIRKHFTHTTKLVPPLPPYQDFTISPTEGDLGGSIAMKNCLLSRKLCAGDPACRSILEIIPRVCGPETVACSTVTVNKCLAALRTVRGFPYFSPVCLCREPHLDHDCNAFREFIFDHPCEFVFKDGEQSPYAVHALPTCDYAARTCEQLPACRSTYDRFKNACRVKEGQCRMEDSEGCLWSWTQLKQLPMYGCICPDDRQKFRCDKIFSVVHHNPCVDAFLASSALPNSRPGAGGAWGLVVPRPAPPRPSPRPPPAHPYNPFQLPSNPPPPPLPHPPRAPWESHPHGPLFLTAPPPPMVSAQTHNVLSVPYPPFRLDGNSRGSISVSDIPFDNTGGGIHDIDSQIQNPLVDGPPGSATKNASRAADVLGSGRHRPADPHTKQATTAVSKAPSLHSTCQTALEGCLADQGCRRLLDPVIGACSSNCSREMCMDNLQTFYRNVESKWAMEVALCLCKKTNQTSNDCLVAQEKLHPSCARKPASAAPLLCSTLARSCKEDSSCRHRLEFYEQACAVDSDTRRCAGSTAECRRALLGILGTRLRNLCTCAAPDPRETYTCLDWQRILWFNPCVVEAQTDYHREMLSALAPGEELTTSASVVIRMTPGVLDGIVGEPVPLNGPKHIITSRPSNYWENYKRENKPLNNNPRPTATTTTTTTTTLPPNYCVKELRNGKTDYIVEGGSKRYYKVSDYCSELCQCFVGENLVCNVLSCIPSIPCETSYAIYTHDAPAYQMSRGECICYSESFICAKPREYNKSEGTFLLIGYSKKEEELLRPFTRLNVMDTIPRLQKLYEESTLQLNVREKRVSATAPEESKSVCRLELFDVVEENLIVKATLEDLDENRDNLTALMLHREKEECQPALEIVSENINSRDPSVYHDVALSMFLISDVQSYLPPLPAKGVRTSEVPCFVLLSFVLSRLLPTL